MMVVACSRFRGKLIGVLGFPVEGNI
jgi:hypothetical protein